MSERQPVELVVIEGESPRLLSAEWVDRREARLSLRLDAELAPGTPVGISGPQLTHWVHGKVTDTQGPVVHIHLRGQMPIDRREFSRVYGGIDLHYQAVGDETFELEAHRWLTLGQSTSALWRIPDPFMDFSVSGLKFHDIGVCMKGDRLLLDFTLPHSRIRHRATAVVVRVARIPSEERDPQPYAVGGTIPTHTVALHFLAMHGDAIEALLQFSEQIQEASVF